MLPHLKICWVWNKFWVKEKFWGITYFGSEKILVWKIRWSYKNSGPKKCWSKKFWGKTVLVPKKWWAQKIFWSKRNFGPQKMLYSKTIFGQNRIYGSKKFWSGKIFGPKNFRCKIVKTQKNGVQKFWSKIIWVKKKS